VHDIVAAVAGEVDLGFAFDLPPDPSCKCFAKLESVSAPWSPRTIR